MGDFMNNFKFKKDSKYTRSEIFKIVTGSDKRPPFAFDRTGYGRIDKNLFIFMNIGIPGRTGEDYKNHYDKRTEAISWCGKGKTHAGQPLMQKIINGELNLYFFGRWESNNNEFTYLGLGHVISYKENVPVVDRYGNDTFCIEYQITCKGVEEISFEDIKSGVLVEREVIAKGKNNLRKKRTFRGKKSQNYLVKEIINKNIGNIGERLVFEFEKKRLSELGKTNLAQSVKHISVTEGDGTGYDIRSYNADGSVRYIEVKTTKHGSNTDFYMSPNEVEFSKKFHENYFIYRVYNLNEKKLTGYFYKSKGNVLDMYNIEPTEYRVYPSRRFMSDSKIVTLLD